MATVEYIAPLPISEEMRTLLHGLPVGLVAAGIGALYVVFARWGIGHGASAMDLTALRFGIAGLILLPVLILRYRRTPTDLTAQWRLWLAVSLLAGTPFGLLMFGALQLAPASHAAVFPFAAMSIMGMVLAAVVLGDRLTLRRIAGIGVVLMGLVLISGINAGSFSLQSLEESWGFFAAKKCPCRFSLYGIFATSKC